MATVVACGLKRAGGDGVVTHRRRRRGDSSRAGVTNRSADKTTRRTARCEKKRNTQPDDAADAPEAAASLKGNGMHPFLDEGLDYNVVGEALYAKIHAVDPDKAGKITGMMLEAGLHHAVMITSNDHLLRSCVAEAQAVLLQHEAASAPHR